MKMLMQALFGLLRARRTRVKPGKPPIRPSVLKTPFYY